MSLKYEPASVPQHISVKWLFFKQRNGVSAGRRRVNEEDDMTVPVLLHRSPKVDLF